MFGVIVNTYTVILGSAAGLLFKQGIPPRISQTIIFSIVLCSAVIGVRGCVESGGSLVLVLSLVTGTAMGADLDIQGKLSHLGEMFGKEGETAQVFLSEGFVFACLMFCVGAMTIKGP